MPDIAQETLRRISVKDISIVETKSGKSQLLHNPGLEELAKEQVRYLKLMTFHLSQISGEDVVTPDELENF